MSVASTPRTPNPSGPTASGPTPSGPTADGSAAPRVRFAADQLLQALGDSRIRTGSWLSEQRAQEAREPRLATSLDDVDRLLGGGFPRGRLSEITGPPSSGRTSLALALAAAATRAGETVAWIDLADALDPASLEAAGADPDRLLWVRAPRPHHALYGAERLLLARGFALVVLDAEGVERDSERHRRSGRRAQRPGSASWARLARCAAASGTALVLLGRAPRLGSGAALVVDLRATRQRFAERPSWLEGLETRIALVRHRLGPADGFVPACWKVSPLAPDAPDPDERPRRALRSEGRSGRERCA